METGEEIGGDESPKENQVLLGRIEDIAVIRLGSPQERVIILNQERMDSLARALEVVKSNRELRGLVIISAQPKIFCAGADINVIRAVTDPAVGRKLAERGQEIFNTIDNLQIPTVAAICGACVGGGCELALACDYRVLADLPQTKIGLPEIKLGIVPGFGGTQRLPRAVGVVRALEIILKGQILPAAKALAIGLADKLVGNPGGSVDHDAVYAELESVALDLAAGKISVTKRARSLMEMALSNNPIGRAVARSRTLREVEKESKGFYPAPRRAVEALFTGLAKGLDAGLAAEAQAIGDLIVTPVSKALVHLYLLSEDSGKLGRGVKEDLAKLRVGVLGAGTMGAGIAAAFLGIGCEVMLFDSLEQARAGAAAKVEGILGKKRSLSAEGRAKILSKFSVVADLTALKDCSVIVEAIIEDLKIKRETFKTLSGLVKEKTLLATNTSSLSVTEIARDVKELGQVIGMHFFNPVEKMPLVEIVRGRETSERAIVQTAALISSLGKYPIVVNDVPGFLVNRILSPYLVEAAHLLAEGIPVEEIDRGASAFGMPMGPVRLLDEVGLDVAAKVAEIMENSYGQRMKGPKFAAQLMGVGRFGRKSGVGFYRYQERDAVVDPDLSTILGIKFDRNKAAAINIGERLVLPLVNEAVRCLDEGVAGLPGNEAAGQIDLGSVMGIGFAPFRGGVIHYAESLGAKTLLQRLNSYQERLGERFTPCQGIKQRAESGGSFYRKG